MKRPAYAILRPLILLMLIGMSLAAQPKNDNVSWKLLTPSVKGAPGKVVEVKVQAMIAARSHMYTPRKYPDTAESAPSPMEITAGDDALLRLAGRVKGTKPVVHFDESFELNTEFWEGNATLIVPLKISAKAKLGPATGWVNFNFQTCNDKACIPPTDVKLTFDLEVTPPDSTAGTDTTAMHPGIDTAAPADPQPLDTLHTDKRDTSAAPPAAPHGGDKPPIKGAMGVQPDKIDEAIAQGLWAFIFQALGFGFLALVTPCVYPMIPITVSFFSKREQKSKAKVLRDSMLYAMGIIFTFTGLGLIIAVIFGATGIQDFATNPYVNIAMTMIFFALALSLFGLFEIQVPTRLLNRLNRKATGSGSASIIMMGLVFSLTSFACTMPFVAALFSKMDSLKWYWPVIGTAAFATAFSVPFFLLAMFPSLLKSIPKSGGWLNSVKVVMGFIEIAFAMKFIAGTDVAWGWNIFTREVCIAVWIAISVLSCVYLLGRFQLSHDTPVEKVGPLRVLFATGFLAVSFWMLTGLFGGNLGELEAQLPLPADDAPAASGPGSAKKADSQGPVWVKDDYDAALAEARRTGKPLFIDFTGYFCTNCRWMERNMFNKREVAALLDKYVLVRLYTDRSDSINKRNQRMQLDRLKTFSLPTYAIYLPNDQLVASSAFTRDQEEFVAFLKKGIAAGSTPLATNTP